jgi:hypothetical protein
VAALSGFAPTIVGMRTGKRADIINAREPSQ